MGERTRDRDLPRAGRNDPVHGCSFDPRFLRSFECVGETVRLEFKNERSGLAERLLVEPATVVQVELAAFEAWKGRAHATS